MDLLVVNAQGSVLAAVGSDPVVDTLKGGQLLGVDMDHVARLLPLVPLHRSLGFRVPQTAKDQRLHHSSHGRQGRAEGPDDSPECAALVP